MPRDNRSVDMLLEDYKADLQRDDSEEAASKRKADDAADRLQGIGSLRGLEDEDDQQNIDEAEGYQPMKQAVQTVLGRGAEISGKLIDGLNALRGATDEKKLRIIEERIKKLQDMFKRDLKEVGEAYQEKLGDRSIKRHESLADLADPLTMPLVLLLRNFGELRILLEWREALKS